MRASACCRRRSAAKSKLKFELQTLENLKIGLLNIAEGKYLIKTHAIQCAIKEGFERRNMIEAINNGKIIENYLHEQRVLICGRTNLNNEVTIYLHIVCEYFSEYVEFVTTYIPDEFMWQNPPFKRRK